MAFPKPDGVVYEGWRRSVVARRAWEHWWGVNITRSAEEGSPCCSVRGGRGGWPGQSELGGAGEVLLGRRSCTSRVPPGDRSSA